ncbi:MULTISPECIES: bestrophin family protein [Reichenbachiella]|uniref:Putative membrane protein n=1 Tax=Reichenbachiella agariperforans TaxID=156994 RepID=A0A1M6R9A9_REIAG|nr:MULTISPECIES: bestrophin family ion channel [Reichenbachiella]MBU2912863.1 hypothetical protein [Reichenbachiella agariperforans]RJE70629.1 hypothetical protein BGP76_11120 [Reichenbachiella sp. MSK19-1]SHK29055.1 putative membrane protein [Reichenbachiella agariperforans]
MIKYNPKNWLVFNFYSRFVFRRLLPMLIGMTAFTVALEYTVLDLMKLHYPGILSFHSILGIFLGLFLVLRTNTAYDRWWEGRKLWGQLVNNTRNLAIKVNTYTEDKETRAFFREMIPNITMAIKEHLRDSRIIGEMEITDDKTREDIIASDHRPNYIANLLYKKAREMKQNGDISELEYHAMDKELKSFSDIYGACERIHSTPIPYSYSMFIKKFVFFYIFTLPFGLVWQFGYWTTLIVLPVFYFLLSLELIAEEIEDPFGTDINDLPLDGLTNKMKANVEEILK